MERCDEERREDQSGPERIERIPGEIESAMYTGSDEGEPTPGPEEIGPPADREEAREVFEQIDSIIEQESEGPAGE